MEYFHDTGVVKDASERVSNDFLKSKSINDEILFSRRDLHQTRDTKVCTLVVMLQIDCDLSDLCQLLSHLFQEFCSINISEWSVIK